MSLYVRAALGILSLVYSFMYLHFIQRYQYIRLCNVELLDRGRGNGKDRGGVLAQLKTLSDQLPLRNEETT